VVGQNKLKELLQTRIDNDNFPRFSLLVGAKGSGRHTLIKEFIVPNTNMIIYELPDVKIETIRNIIRVSYKVTAPTLYIISNADDMSTPAKNALLKVTEEPPNNAYFIMLLENEQNTLATLRSRGTLLRLDYYSVDDIANYYNHYTDIAGTPEECSIVRTLCETPGEVQELVSYGVIEFSDYVNKVVDNISIVSGANAFKIGDKLNFKDDYKKYSLKLFWKAFMSNCLDRVVSDDSDMAINYLVGEIITSKYLQQLRLKGINKQSLFDMWLLDIRKEWN